MPSENEIKILEKGLDFAPLQRKVNERKIRIKRLFWNEPSDSEIPAFRPKSSWKPSTRHPNLEVFLSSVEQELFKVIEIPLRYSNLSSEELGAIRSLVDNRSIVIKKADKGSTVVVWERDYYVKEAQKQLRDGKEKLLSGLVDKSKSFFKELKTKGCMYFGKKLWNVLLTSLRV